MPQDPPDRLELDLQIHPHRSGHHRSPRGASREEHGWTQRWSAVVNIFVRDSREAGGNDLKRVWRTHEPKQDRRKRPSRVIWSNTAALLLEGMGLDGMGCWFVSSGRPTMPKKRPSCQNVESAQTPSILLLLSSCVGRRVPRTAYFSLSSPTLLL